MEFLSALGLRQVSVVGHSRGAEVALCMAARYPDTVARLVVVDGDAYRRPSGPKWNTETTGAAAGISREKVRRWLEDVFADHSFLTDGLVDEWRARKLAGIHAVHSWLDALDRATNGLSDTELRSITAPTLIVWGTEDRRVPGRAERQVQDIKGSRLVRLEGAGHYPQYGRAAELAAVLNGFVSHPLAILIERSAAIATEDTSGDLGSIDKACVLDRLNAPEELLPVPPTICLQHAVGPLCLSSGEAHLLRQGAEIAGERMLKRARGVASSKALGYDRGGQAKPFGDDGDLLGKQAKQ